MADLRQFVPVDLSPLASPTMATHLHGFVWRSRLRKIGWDRRIGIQCEQVALPLVFRHTFAPAAIGPTLVPRQLVQGGGVLLLESLVRGRRLVQHPVQLCRPLLGCKHATFEFGGLLEGSQQKSLTFGQIVGKKIRSVHVAEYCSNSCEQEKPSFFFFFNRRGDISAAGVPSANPDHRATAPVGRSPTRPLRSCQKAA